MAPVELEQSVPCLGKSVDGDGSAAEAGCQEQQHEPREPIDTETMWGLPAPTAQAEVSGLLTEDGK